MADGVTLVAGANATPAAGTTYNADETSSGKVPGVKLLYSADGSDTPVLVDTNGVKVQGSTTLSGLTAATINTPISIGDAAADTQLIAANSSRKGWTVQNLSTADLYVRMGGGAAAIGTCHRVLRQYESMGQRIMDGDLCLGEIRGRWASDAGGTAVGGDWQ